MSVLPVAASVVAVYHPYRDPQAVWPLSILSLSNIPSAPLVPSCCLSLVRFLNTRLIDETWRETNMLAMPFHDSNWTWHMKHGFIVDLKNLYINILSSILIILQSVYFFKIKYSTGLLCQTFKNYVAVHINRTHSTDYPIYMFVVWC